MTIDGDLSEWGYANAMIVDASYQVKGSGIGLGRGRRRQRHRADHCTTARTSIWRCTVKDNVKLANGNTGSAIVNGDGVELYLSTYIEQYNTTRGAPTARQYDYHLAISYADTPQAYMLSHSRALTGAVISQGRHQRRLRHRGADPVEQLRQPDADPGRAVRWLHASTASSASTSP